jgi:uncharacterized protein YjiS (DUF1127 family)
LPRRDTNQWDQSRFAIFHLEAAMTMLSLSLHANVTRSTYANTSLLKHFREMLREWCERYRSRHELADMSALDVKDIGYPADRAAEVGKAVLEGVSAKSAGFGPILLTSGALHRSG